MLPSRIGKNLTNGSMYELLCDLWNFDNLESWLKFIIRPFF